MVYRRRYRKSAVKKAGMKKRAFRRYRKRGSQQGVLKIHRLTNEQRIVNGATAGLTNISVNGSGPVSINSTSESTPFSSYCNVLGSAVYALSDLPSASDITNLCDKYRIKAVKHEFICTSTMASANGLGQMPMLVWHYDADDNVFPISAQSLKLKQGVKMAQLTNGKKITIWVKPKMIGDVTSAASPALAPTAPSVLRSQWINSTYPGASHYGLKFAIEDVIDVANTTAIFQVKVNTTYYVEGRDFQ